MAGDEFAALLRELKERSGLSFGVLGKRLHLSASTLHRYVNGDAVPTDYAPVERFARQCKATPEELVELHRLWVRADALRGRKGGESGAASAAVSPVAGPASPGPTTPEPTPEPTTTPEQAVIPEPETASAAPAAPGRRRRTVLLAGIGVAAAAVSVALVVSLVPRGGDGGGDDRRQSVGAGAAVEESSAAPDAKQPGGSGSSPSSAAPDGQRSTKPPAGGSGAREEAADGTGGGGALEPTVAVNPYKWDSPCSQHYLVDRDPAQMPPPPANQQEARRWVEALGGVPAGEQMVALTVQGRGKDTVVLEDLHVRVLTKNAPLRWSDYAMGVGCGGGVSTKSFAVDLDAGRPDTAPTAGQRDFPYKVSETDPEVFYVTAQAQAHDVQWFLELEWSSGGKHGTVRIDDNGKPFRTSARTGRPGFDYPLGGGEWIPAHTEAPEGQG